MNNTVIFFLIGIIIFCAFFLAPAVEGYKAKCEKAAACCKACCKKCNKKLCQ